MLPTNYYRLQKHFSFFFSRTIHNVLTLRDKCRVLVLKKCSHSFFISYPPVDFEDKPLKILFLFTLIPVSTFGVELNPRGLKHVKAK